MLVTTPCPQCGGDIEFLDESHAIKCRYCGSSLHLVNTEGVRKYYFEPKASKETVVKALIRGLYQKKQIKIYSISSRLIFYPYWWIKGLVFKWILGKKTIPSKGIDIPDIWENFKELKTHLFDHTFPANQEISLGLYSLGVRPEAIKIRAFNRKEMERWGLPLKPDIPFARAVALAEKTKDSTLKVQATSILTSQENLSGLSLKSENTTVEMEKTCLIGERYSLIFFPIWILSLTLGKGSSELLVDGLSHSVIKNSKKGEAPWVLKLSEDMFHLEPGDLRFIPLRCPICGWDLPFHPFNVIHLCITCGRAWQEKGGSFQEVTYKVVKGKGGHEEGIKFLPFWTFSVSLITPKEQLTNLDQFYQYFPLPHLINREKEIKRPIKFYIPAFRIKNIPVVNKFSTMFTQNQPYCEYVDDSLDKEILTKNEVGDVFLSANEAKEMCEILLFSLIPATSRKAKNFVSQAQIKFLQEQLEWYPFREDGIYLREENTGYALQKAAMGFLGLFQS